MFLCWYVCAFCRVFCVLASVPVCASVWLCLSVFGHDFIRVLVFLGCVYACFVYFMCVSVFCFCVHMCVLMCESVCMRAWIYLQTAAALRTTFSFLNFIFRSVDYFIIDFMIFNTNIMILDIIQRPVLSKNTIPFIFQNTTFRRLDSVSVFR
jgi:hypothetical protein